MFERIRQSVLALGEGAGALFPFAAPFLACAPVFLFLVWFVLCLCSRRVRKGSKCAYLFVCDFFLLLFAALALFSPDALAAVGVALAAADEKRWLVIECGERTAEEIFAEMKRGLADKGLLL